jgi:hypothetical protein
MPLYIKHNSNGEIVSVLKSDTAMSSDQIGTDTITLENPEVDVTINTHYVNIATNTLAEYTAEQKLKRTQKPLYKTAWDMAAMRWMDLRTATELKTEKEAEINRVRQKLNLLPIDYDNTKFDADENSQSNLRGWISVLNSGGVLPINFVWRDFYNVDREVDAAWLIGLQTAIINRTTALYERSWELKQQLNNIPDTDILAINRLQVYGYNGYSGTPVPNWPGIGPYPQ